MAGVFKAYDIRGLYNENITEDFAYKLGRAYVCNLNPKTVLIGRDTRLSTPSLAESLIKGITDQGADVIDTGMSTTDMYYYSMSYTQADNGIMITASHNPGQYNGFKLTRKNAAPIGAGSGMEELEKTFHEGNFPEVEKKGTVREEKGMVERFVKYIHSRVNVDKIKPLKVVMDAGNGMAGLVAPEMFKDTNIEPIPLFFELDGNFPNHEANPLLEENRVDLIAKVKETGADFGVGFDGDSDRCFFVDENGKFVDNDFMTGLIAVQLLKSNPGRIITHDVRCSKYIKDKVEEAGGATFMWKVGHAPMKPKMKELNALFGGEVSGHFYFDFDEYYADNSYMPVFIVAELISESGKKLSELLEDTKNYFISGEINSSVKDADSVLEALETKYSPTCKVEKIDGLSIISDTWWFSVRKSNTEPLVRLNCEANSQDEMEKMRDEVLSIIRA